MLRKKSFAIGESDFKSIIDDNCYYFDKTKFIEELIEDRSRIKLFTRPRRFGKTLNMTMLKYFFDVKNKEEHRGLFKGLDIEKSPYFKKQGKHPVIFVSFRDVKFHKWKNFYERIETLISSLYNEFDFLENKLNKLDKIRFENIWLEKDDKMLSIAIRYLSELLSKFYNKKVILLIDEYDTPLISAHEYGYYDEAINFFKTLLSTALKDNPYLEMAVLTGIVRVANENIFSGLNNLKVYTILDEKYADSFGLTEDEVKEALAYYEMTEVIEEVKAWYNGYRFGNYDIYNPWSITNYLSDGKTGVYWINTSGNYLIKKALKLSDTDVFDELNVLLNGKSIEKVIDISTSFVDMDKELLSWQLLLFSGYLTVEKKLDSEICELKLTNYEVRKYFAEQFIAENFGRDSLFTIMMRALINEDFKVFEKNLQKIMMRSISPIDTRKEELVYHMYFLGMTSYLMDTYIVRSNEYTGKGRSDITLEPIDKSKTGYIIEFKVAKDEKDFEELHEKALKQIKEKEYVSNMQERGIKKIIGVSMVFYAKDVKVEVERLV